MNCPVCDGKLREVERQGIQIDVCPECKGVWLDRGELEKLLDADAQRTQPVQRTSRDGLHETIQRAGAAGSQRSDDGDDRSRGGAHRKRRGSWLGDILEGFGD